MVGTTAVFINFTTELLSYHNNFYIRLFIKDNISSDIVCNFVSILLLFNKSVYLIIIPSIFLKK